MNTPKNMKIDGKQKPAQTSEPTQEDTSVIEIMEEEAENVDLHGLDINELELACRKKAFESIAETDLEKLEMVISKVYQQHQLGIQAGSTWDGRLHPKDFKKRGRKTVLQRTIELGEVLVDSAHYAKLTKYFSPSQPSYQ